MALVDLILRLQKGEPLTNQEMDNNLSNLAAGIDQSSCDWAGPLEPEETFPYLRWIDTSTNPPTNKIRNAEDDDWIALGSATTPLGTAATRDVTASYTDTTPGRAMVLGTWGFGGVSPRDNLVHADDMLPGQRRNWSHQFTEADAVAVGLPALGGTPGASRCWNVEAVGITARVIQYATEVFGSGGTTKGRTFIRVKQDSTWHPWQEVYTTGNIVGTVSHSGGVPTGAIIERGSTANGQYVRYADGTQICTVVGRDLVYLTAFRLSYDWIFPAAFSSTLYVGVPVVRVMSEDGQPGAADKYRGHVRVDSHTTTQARFSLMSGGDFLAGDTATCRLLAIGQWR